MLSTPFIRVPPVGYGGTELFCYALGETSALPPVLAAWSAPVAFAALAVTVLLYVEG